MKDSHAAVEQPSPMKLTCTYDFVRPFRLTRIKLEHPALTGQAKIIRLIQLTDIHFGITPLSFIQKAVALTNSLNADSIVLTGDFIQGDRFGSPMFGPHSTAVPLSKFRKFRDRARSLAEQLGSELTRLRCSGPIITTLGNHDYYEGVRILRAAFPSNFHWLVNQSLFLDFSNSTLQISGLDDFKRGKPNLALCDSVSGRARELDTKPAIKILLTHNPDALISIERSVLSSYSLVLAGHTHGGQICLPGGFPLLTRTKQKEHVKGLSWREETPIYVSNGVGYGGFRIRTFCPPEIVAVELIAPTD